MLRYPARFFANKPLTTSKFMQRELMENPEFFKAFPHLQRAFDKNLDDVHNQEPSRRMQKNETPGVIYNYKEDKAVKWINT